MTNGNQPPPPPALTLVEKLYAVNNLNSVVPVKLDIDELNYSSWCYFFKIHCNNFGVLKHIEGEATTSTFDPPTEEWLTADSIVKSWILLTLAPTLQGRLIKANPPTAKAAWEHVEKLFQDKKRTRTIALKDDDIVTYAINGLSEKFANLATVIAHKDPFPDLDTMRSMVATEEMRLNSRPQLVSTNTTSSAPQVLLAENNPSGGQDSRNSRDARTTGNNREVCRNFNRGYCRWGDTCRFIHNSTRSTGTSNNNSSRGSNGQSRSNTNGNTTFGQSRGLDTHQQLLSLLQAQQNLIAQFGLQGALGQSRVGLSLLGSRPSLPGFGLSSAQQSTSHNIGVSGVHPPMQQMSPQQQALLAQAVYGSGSTVTPHGQETLLPQAFNTMTLQDPTTSNWNMDTGLLDPPNPPQM